MSGTTINFTEKQFQDQVIAVARMYGWRVTHYMPAKLPSGRYATALQGHKGAPDLILAKGGKVILAELKTSKGTTSPDQDEWLAALGESGRLWRPEHIEDIKRELSRPVRTVGSLA